MRTHAIVAMMAGTCLLGGQPSNINEQLTAQYRPTNVGANGVVVGQMGSVFVVQKDNIKSNPASNQLYWSNLYKKDGRVKQPAMMVKSGVSQVDRSTIRFLQVGEKVYVTNIQVKPADVVFSLQSCGDDTPYRAEVAFQFQKGFVTAANFSQIQESIAQVLAVDNSPAPTAATSDTAVSPVAATADEEKPKPIKPPDALPPTVLLGMTIDQVIGILGQPQRAAEAGPKTIYSYKDLKVVFVDGKVTDIQ